MTDKLIKILLPNGHEIEMPLPDGNEIEKIIAERCEYYNICEKLNCKNDPNCIGKILLKDKKRALDLEQLIEVAITALDGIREHFDDCEGCKVYHCGDCVEGSDEYAYDIAKIALNKINKGMSK